MKLTNLLRKILLVILAYEGLGGLLGGTLLILGPDGHYMNIPPSVLHGEFADFIIPGIILTGMGLLTTIAFIAVLTKHRFDWVLASMSMYGFIIWFAVEIAVVREIVWLHYMWGLPVVVGGLIVLPKISFENKNID
ncbi:MAG TPA: hypothetical protein VG965_06795 [Patescibacteria group bacterium]|nr:hypothetical protein [Patescibacteria group bacterium]